MSDAAPRLSVTQDEDGHAPREESTSTVSQSVGRLSVRSTRSRTGSFQPLHGYFSCTSKETPQGWVESKAVLFCNPHTSSLCEIFKGKEDKSTPFKSIKEVKHTEGSRQVTVVADSPMSFKLVTVDQAMVLAQLVKRLVDRGGDCEGLLVNQPNWQLEAPVSGVVEKKGKHMWASRHLVVFPGWMYVFRSADVKKSPHPLNVFSLWGEVNVCKADDPRAFAVKVSQRSFQFRSKNEEVCTDWVTSINERFVTKRYAPSNTISEVFEEAQPVVEDVKTEKRGGGGGLVTNFVRTLVSKKKKRFEEDGYNLDLTYITPQIVAMGFPSEGVEGKYRNPMPEVQNFFNERHTNNYRIYNLCSERKYSPDKFDGRVACFPFDDHNPPTLQLMVDFCKDAEDFLKDNAKGVIVVHCKAGKGRTGTMICAYFVFTGEYTAEEALKFYGEQRTFNGKGVTIPSQIRYVRYFERVLKDKIDTTAPAPTMFIRTIRLHTVPHFDNNGGCDPYFILKSEEHEKFHSKTVQPIQALLHEKTFDFDCRALAVTGNVRIVFYDEDKLSADDKMFHFWFNTTMIENNHLVLTKSELDKACKDKNNKLFDADFKIEIFFAEQ